jgi:hypothetical protein
MLTAYFTLVTVVFFAAIAANVAVAVTSLRA